VKRPAVFLDKDGTLVEDVPFNVDPARIVLRPGATEALRTLDRLGYQLVLVSNQAGVAFGRFPIEALRDVERFFVERFATEGFAFTAFQWCPHHPGGTVPRYAIACGCRKPLPGMLQLAAARHELDLGASWMVGDILDDVEAGHRAGCRSILLDVGSETEWKQGPLRDPDFTVPDLAAAVAAIQAATALRARVAV
jgi:D-glycero-D-manno-heptose 1,7-bisphosphate phosphatase